MTTGLTKIRITKIRDQITKLESTVTEAAWAGAKPPAQAAELRRAAVQQRMRLEAHIFRVINTIIEETASNG